MRLGLAVQGCICNVCFFNLDDKRVFITCSLCFWHY